MVILKAGDTHTEKTYWGKDYDRKQLLKPY